MESRRVAPPSSLSWNVDAAQESAQMAGQRNDHGRHKLERQAVRRKHGTCNSPPPEMNPPDQADKKTRDASQREVKQ